VKNDEPEIRGLAQLELATEIADRSCGGQRVPADPAMGQLRATIGHSYMVMTLVQEIRATGAELSNALATYSPSSEQPVQLKACGCHAKPVENSGDSGEGDRAARGQLVAVLFLVNVLLVIVAVVAVLA
jgi:hypothetical protein